MNSCKILGTKIILNFIFWKILEKIEYQIRIGVRVVSNRYVRQYKRSKGKNQTLSFHGSKKTHKFTQWQQSAELRELFQTSLHLLLFLRKLATLSPSKTNMMRRCPSSLTLTMVLIGLGIYFCRHSQLLAAWMRLKSVLTICWKVLKELLPPLSTTESACRRNKLTG